MWSAMIPQFLFVEKIGYDELVRQLEGDIKKPGPFPGRSPRRYPGREPSSGSLYGRLLHGPIEFAHGHSQQFRCLGL